MLAPQSEIYLIIILLFHICQTIRRHFLFIDSSCALVIGNTKKSLRPKEGRSDQPIDQASEFTLAHLTPISHSAK